MANIINFPGSAAKLGYTRVKHCKKEDHPDQLQLFSQPSARVVTFVPEQSSFDEALALDERGDAGGAEELYQKAIQEESCVPDAHCNLGIIESQKGNVTKAFDYFTTSLKHDPRHAEAHYNLGNLYFEVSDYKLAQVHYEIAGQIAPSFANVFFNLALVRALNNDLPGAVLSLTTYQSLVPPDKAREAEELLGNLRASLSATPGSTGASSTITQVDFRP